MDYRETAALLRENNNILIITHRRPDGDTIGCAVALCAALRALGKTAWVLENPDATSLFTPYLEGYTIALSPPPGGADGGIPSRLRRLCRHRRGQSFYRQLQGVAGAGHRPRHRPPPLQRRLWQRELHRRYARSLR